MGLWALLGVIAWITKYFPGKYNNFSIFRQSFWHTLNELPLYAAYPEEYNDIFHYGPVFSLVIAPFAVTPLWLGLLTWSVAQSLFLFWAIKMLPGIKRERIFIYWFCAHELLTSLFMSQFNISIAAIIVLAYVLIEKEKDVWAAFVIMLGTFTKLYGITGLAFFFFSRHKMKFSLSCVGWAVVMVVAPMILSGPDYIMSQYTGYFEDDASDELTNDPVFKSVLEKDALASQPTVSRFFNRMDEDTLNQFLAITRVLRMRIYSIQMPCGLRLSP